MKVVADRKKQLWIRKKSELSTYQKVGGSILCSYSLHVEVCLARY